MLAHLCRRVLLLEIVRLYIRDSVRLMFQQGAMPRVQTVSLGYFHVQDTRDGENVDFVFGLENLLSLECVQCIDPIYSDMESALRHAVQIHSNHPTFNVC